jgi:MFS family permease
MSPRLTAAYRKTFASLHGSRNFRLYLMGQVVSATGTWMNFTASSWLVLQLTHSGVALGVNAALNFGPVLLFGAFGGVLADRHDRRRILSITQASFAAVSLTLAALVFSGAIELWMVYVLSFISGAIISVDNPTRQSFYVEMVGQDSLTNAVSLNSAAFTGSRIVGPAIAGILIQAVGMSICFLFDGLSYLAVLAALLAMRRDELHAQRRSTRERGHLVAGLRYVWATDELRRPLIVMTVIFTIAFNWAVLIPLLAEQAFHAGPREFGVLSASAGVGAFVAAIVIANRSPVPSMRNLGLAALATGVAMVGVALTPSLWLASAVMIPVGFAAMAFMITGNTSLQVNAKPQARGRVMALYGMVFLGSTPIGAPIVGFLGQHLGARAAFLVVALAPVAVGAVILWRERRRHAEPHVEATGGVGVPA